MIVISFYIYILFYLLFCVWLYGIMIIIINIAVCSADLEKLDEVRAGIPIWKQRRTDLYDLVDKTDK